MAKTYESVPKMNENDTQFSIFSGSSITNVNPILQMDLHDLGSDANLNRQAYAELKCAG